MILTLHYRKSPVMRANSLLLNALIFFGCYSLCISSIAETALLESAEGSNDFLLLCNIRVWFWSLGMNFILGTNLVRLGRIYRLFTHFGQTGLLLSNVALFCYVLLLGIFPCLLLAVWTIADPLHFDMDTAYYLDQNPPHVEYITRCTCHQYSLWLSALLLFFGIMLVVMMFFAFQTRKIKYGHFKDTKKILIFVFFLLFTMVFSISSSMILRQISLTMEHYGAIAQTLGNFTVCLLCMAFLIAPKALPVLYEHVTTGKYKTVSDRKASLTQRQRSSLIQILMSI